MQRIVTKAKLEGVTYHTLRHSYATLLISGLKQDVESVSRQLGHANSAITLKVYSHVWDSVRNTDQLREALSGHFEGASGSSTRFNAAGGM